MKIRLVSLVFFAAPACAFAASTGRDFLQPQRVPGANFSNVFSIAASLRVAGFDELVGRNSGSADYTLTQVVWPAMEAGAATLAKAANGTNAESKDAELRLSAIVAYDGVPIDHAENIIRDHGATQCWKGECRVYTDASGLVYNRLLWGDIPTTLTPGQTWQVRIAQPWELGPAGTQTVRVIALDEHNGSVTLQREGNAVGAFAGEAAQVTLSHAGHKVVFDVTPGQAHWSGLATFQRGIVINDELLMTRSDTLTSAETGPLPAQRRRYMLLNAAPYPTLE